MATFLHCVICMPVANRLGTQISLARLNAPTRNLSFDHFIRPLKHAAWNRQTDLFCCLEIDDELKLRRLLHWQISRLGTFQYLVNVNSGATIEVSEVVPI